MKTDIEIAQEAKMKPITEIAAQLGLSDEHVIPTVQRAAVWCKAVSVLCGKSSRSSLPNGCKPL